SREAQLTGLHSRVRREQHDVSTAARRAFREAARMKGPGLSEFERRVERLADEARKNEEAWKRAQAREMELLEADDLATLLARATDGLRTGHRLEAVTLILVDDEHELRHLLMGEGASPGEFPSVLFVDALPDALPFDRAAPRPWLGAFDGGRHATIF